MIVTLREKITLSGFAKEAPSIRSQELYSFYFHCIDVLLSPFNFLPPTFLAHPPSTLGAASSFLTDKSYHTFFLSRAPLEAGVTAGIAPGMLLEILHKCLVENV